MANWPWRLTIAMAVPGAIAMAMAKPRRGARHKLLFIPICAGGLRATHGHGHPWRGHSLSMAIIIDGHGMAMAQPRPRGHDSCDMAMMIRWCGHANKKARRASQISFLMAGRHGPPMMASVRIMAAVAVIVAAAQRAGGGGWAQEEWH